MKIDINKAFAKVTHLFKNRGGIDVMREPVRDWGRMVIFFSLALLLVVGANVIFFKDIVSGKFGRSEANITQSETINRNALKSVVDYYAAREQKLNELKSAKPFVVDPSR